MNLSGPAIAPLALLAPLAVAVVALPLVGRHLALVRAGTTAARLGILVAVGAAGLVFADGSVTSATLGIGLVGASLRLDPLSVTMLLMITILAEVIFRYSCTYLEGDPRRDHFLRWLAATIAAVEMLVVAGNLAVLVVAWIATSLALHQLLVFRGERPRARLAARKKFVVARIGDVLLVTAAVILLAHFGTGDLGDIFAAASNSTATWQLGAVTVAALCLALAACLKSAQFPTHGWLVEVMEAPTPVSALLHAGILNAGPFLAIRMAYVLDGSKSATTLLILVGGFTAGFASVVLLTQPSVKVQLGYSSAAHMGFMLMVCGLGFYPAALLHLVAHSFYKAHAFLSSGSVVDEHRAHSVRLPRRLGSPVRVVASALVALAWYVPLAMLWGVDLGAPTTLLIGAVLLLGTTQLVAPALDSDGPVAGTVRAALLALAVTGSFFALETGAHSLLADTVPEAVSRDLAQVLLAFVILAAFTLIVTTQILAPARAGGRRRAALAVHLRNGLYANAWFDRLAGALRTNQQGVVRPAVRA